MGKDAEEREDFELSSLAKGIEKYQHSHRRRLDKQLGAHTRPETPIGLRRRGKHTAKITTMQQLDIADRVIRGCEPISDLAKEFRVSQSRISQIVSLVRKKPEVIRERISKETEQAMEDEDLALFVETKLDKGEVLVRADDVRKDFEQENGLSFKVHRVRKVMRERLGLKYNKIVPLPVHGNSERCLVQRQQCALEFFRQLEAGKRIINIDESWIASGDYRRRSW